MPPDGQGISPGSCTRVASRRRTSAERGSRRAWRPLSFRRTGVPRDYASGTPEPRRSVFNHSQGLGRGILTEALLVVVVLRPVQDDLPRLRHVDSGSRSEFPVLVALEKAAGVLIED